jgi:hypothetical protein
LTLTEKQQIINYVQATMLKTITNGFLWVPQQHLSFPENVTHTPSRALCYNLRNHTSTAAPRTKLLKLMAQPFEAAFLSCPSSFLVPGSPADRLLPRAGVSAPGVSWNHLVGDSCWPWPVPGPLLLNYNVSILHTSQVFWDGSSLWSPLCSLAQASADASCSPTRPSWSHLGTCLSSRCCPALAYAPHLWPEPPSFGSPSFLKLCPCLDSSTESILPVPSSTHRQFLSQRKSVVRPEKLVHILAWFP